MKHETKRRIIYTFACFIVLIVIFFLFRNFIKVASEHPEYYKYNLSLPKKEVKEKSKDVTDEDAATAAAVLLMSAGQ